MDVHEPHTTNSWVVPVIGGRIPEVLVTYKKKTDALKTTLFKPDEKRTPTLPVFFFRRSPKPLQIPNYHNNPGFHSRNMMFFPISGESERMAAGGSVG